MQKLSLTALGGICIFGGLMSKLIMGQFNPPSNRSELLGQAMAQVLFLVIGVVLIAVGLVKDRQRR